MEHDARLIDLEIKVSFTEDMVEALNKTVFRQQEQIDMLIQEINRLRQQSSEERAVGAHRASDDLPPHY
ncbi:MAG: SlyX family protein [Burkholderiaceae bacterium]